MTEFERSYVFDLKSAPLLKSALGPEIDSDHIYDSYLSSDLRIRSINGQYLLTSKLGEKSTGKREEREILVSQEATNVLRSLSKLDVCKIRYTYKPVGFDEYKITLDFIESPMKLIILEIESNEHEIPELVVSNLLKSSPLQECPLSAFKFFKRRIGICGGPSSGKSETAKLLSHKLNTVYGANSFHVAEFVTTFIQKYNRPPHKLEQLMVYTDQKNRELAAGRANIVISDCPTFLAYIYLLYFNSKDPISVQNSVLLPKMYKRSLSDAQSFYDNIVFLKIKNYVDNGIRYQTPDEAKQIENRIGSFLKDHGIKHTEATYSDDLIEDLFYINKLRT